MQRKIVVAQLQTISQVVRQLLPSGQVEDSNAAATGKEDVEGGWKGIVTARIRSMSTRVMAVRSALDGDGIGEEALVGDDRSRVATG